MMSTVRTGAPVSASCGSDRVAELACEPDAPFWAEACGWVPGTGHCRNSECGAACLFAPQRAAEAHRVARWRRLRRAITPQRDVP
jgi:hypothetical protein